MTAAAFKDLFLPLHKKLYRIAYRMLESQEDAEDILQETYTKLWEKRATLEEVINKEAFAVTILKNACFDFLKKSKPYALPEEGFDLPDSYSILTQIESNNKLEWIGRIIEQLPEQQRKVFGLHFRDEYSLEEIEEITGLNYGNVKMIISRIRKAIKNSWTRIETI